MERHGPPLLSRLGIFIQQVGSIDIDIAATTATNRMRHRGWWRRQAGPAAAGLWLLWLLLGLCLGRLGHSFKLNSGFDLPPPHAAGAAAATTTRACAAFCPPLPIASPRHGSSAGSRSRTWGRALEVAAAGGVADADAAAEAEQQEEQDFLGRLQRSLLEERTFVRLTLTNGKGKGSGVEDSEMQQQPQPTSPPVDKLLARLIEGASGGSGGGASSDPRVQVVYTHPTSATTKTLALAEVPASLAQSLRGALVAGRLKAARLFTTEGDWVLERGKGGRLRLYRNKATFTAVEVGAHDRAKKRRLAMPGLDEEDGGGEEGAGGATAAGAAGFMEAYGILDSRGQPKKGMRDKHRQIERFVEILEAQLRQWEEADCASADGPRRLRLLDAGCGRGLLTFAAYEFLTARGYAVEARGVDIRPDVVAKANAVAASLGYAPGLTFVQGSIAGLLAAEGEGVEQDEQGSSFDVVIALHACDTASDDALHLGVRAGAGVILASPCCHKEVRWEMKRAMKEPTLAPGLAAQAAVLRHGILLERQAELLTDSLRALCLESQGYKAQVIEFINDEATSKNLMLTATRRRRRSAGASSGQAARQLRELMGHWGLRTQHLAGLLGLLEKSD